MMNDHPDANDQAREQVFAALGTSAPPAYRPSYLRLQELEQTVNNLQTAVDLLNTVIRSHQTRLAAMEERLAEHAGPIKHL